MQMRKISLSPSSESHHLPPAMSTPVAKKVDVPSSVVNANEEGADERAGGGIMGDNLPEEPEACVVCPGNFSSSAYRVLNHRCVIFSAESVSKRYLSSDEANPLTVVGHTQVGCFALTVPLDEDNEDLCQLFREKHCEPVLYRLGRVL
jgi:hypothetical protein